MKNALLFASLVLTSFGLSAQSIKSVTPDKTHPGDTIKVLISGKDTWFQKSSPNSGDVQSVFLSLSTVRINASMTNILSDTTLESEFRIPQSTLFGSYRLTVSTYSQGDLSLEGAISIIFEGIGEGLRNTERVVVYPNPAKSSDGNITVTDEQFEPGKRYTMILYNAAGKKVFEQAGRIPLTGSNITADISTLPTGIYILSFTEGNHHAMQKVVVTR